MIDRSEVNRALAKAIAYKQCGKDADARTWARRLVEILECAEILAPEAIVQFRTRSETKTIYGYG